MVAHSMTRVAAGVLFLAGTATLGASTGAAQIGSGGAVLAPHRAVYEITLDKSRGGSGVSDMSGRMVYELTGSTCDGYTQTMRFVTRMTNQEGTTAVTDMRSNSWEDALSKSFRFSSSQYKDTKLSESTQGEASRPATANDGRVELSKPGKKEIKLKSNVYFPIQHSIELLTLARRGEALFHADLYDGSEKGEKVYSTTAYIGRGFPEGHNKTLPAVANAEALNTLKSWPVSISYFEQGADKKDAVPAYELAFVYFDNGVSRKLFIDYGDFAVRGALKDITFLEAGKCDATPKKK